MKTNIKSLLVTAVAALTLFVAVPVAQAQGGRGQFGMMRGGAQTGAMTLLRRGDVKKDIKLTDEQKTKLTALQEKQQGDFDTLRQNAASFRDMSEEERTAAIKKITDQGAEYNKQAEAILTAEQKTRLGQITVQMAGNGIVNDAKYAEKLKLTDDQKSKIKDLGTKMGEANASLREKMQNQEMDIQDAIAAMRKNSEAMNAEIGKLLTDDQKKMIADWSGPKFERDPADDQPRRGGGGI